MKTENKVKVGPDPRYTAHRDAQRAEKLERAEFNYFMAHEDFELEARRFANMSYWGEF